jgi:peptide/nickel transport system ATP-binding protein/oligopeptide transport system ATP-binding protein
MPYTAGLLDSIPRLGRARNGQRLPAIPGQVPTLAHLPAGCRFSNRCRHATTECTMACPALDAVAAGHHVRCLRWRDLPLEERSRA